VYKLKIIILKFKQKPMKKVILALAVVTFFAACNSGETTEAAKDAIDSTANAAAATVDSTTKAAAATVDSTVKAADSTVKAVVDSAVKK
jgi:hypothetical protein